MLRPKAHWPAWLIKCRLPEYWGVKIIYFYPFLYIFFHALKLKNKFYPVILNPSIDDSGGFIGASKTHINSLFPSEYLPASMEYHPGENILEFASTTENKIGFPCFIKPYDTYRGLGVEKIENKEELIQYITKNAYHYYVQALLGQPEEYGVFVVREPGKKLRILSLTAKEFLTITGDGKHTVQQLLQQNIRYTMAKKVIDEKWEKRFHEIPPDGSTWLIQPVGNHNKGTHFRDVSHRITDRMETLFDRIVPQLGVHYGRFDVKAENLESLETGTGLGIVEFNGTIAEPVSYCDPAYSFFQGQRIIMRHYREQLRIARIMLQNGAVAPGLQEGIQILRKAKQFKKEKVFTFSR